MKTVQISLNSIDKVKSFVNAITQFEYDFDLISGRYVIDAKSIMGIFSLDLSKPIDLAIHAEANVDEIMEVLKPYLIQQILPTTYKAISSHRIICGFFHTSSNASFLFFYPSI